MSTRARRWLGYVLEPTWIIAGPVLALQWLVAPRADPHEQRQIAASIRGACAHVESDRPCDLCESLARRAERGHA